MTNAGQAAAGKRLNVATRLIGFDKIADCFFLEKVLTSSFVHATITAIQGCSTERHGD